MAYIDYRSFMALLADNGGKQLVDRIIDMCIDKKNNLGKELHDTHELSAEILCQVENELFLNMEQLFLNLMRQNIPNYDTNKYYYSRLVPPKGKERVRYLRLSINEILNQIYQSDPDFKYYKKNNNKNSFYTVWKDSKYKSKQLAIKILVALDCDEMTAIVKVLKDSVQDNKYTRDSNLFLQRIIDKLENSLSNKENM